MTTETTQTKPTLVERQSIFPTQEEFAKLDLKTTAAKIRYLRGLQEKEDRGAIAKYLGIRYQWVRNVLTTPIKD